MKNVTLPDGEQLPRIGFGTWRIGGDSAPDPSQDTRSLDALRSALELGYTLFDTAEMYAHGHAEELLGQAVCETGIERENLYITSKVTHSHLQYEQVLQACEHSLRRLGMDYLDLYLIHWPSLSTPLEETFRALNQLVRNGKVRHLGVSNFDLSLQKQAQALCETPLITNQVPYSLSDRTYLENGVLDYCRANGMLLTAHSPIDQGRLRVTPALQEIAQAHQATPFQIALSWLVGQPSVITIPMSFDPQHQKENLEAAEIELSPDEIERLTLSR
jgi:diketogulonate reductase-like aldo/keto reductase